MSYRIMIDCDGDGCAESYESPSLLFVKTDEDARRDGWTIRGDHHLCKECTEKTARIIANASEQKK